MSPPLRVTLTRERREVLRLMANGLTDQQIAIHLRTDKDAVAYHCRMIYRHLSARNRANAVAIALARGLLRPSEVHCPQPKGEK